MPHKQTDRFLGGTGGNLEFSQLAGRRRAAQQPAAENDDREECDVTDAPYDTFPCALGSFAD